MRMIKRLNQNHKTVNLGNDNFTIINFDGS